MKPPRTKQDMKNRAKRPMVRAIVPSDPIRLQPTWYMCRLAVIPGGRAHLAAARFALKERKLELLRQIEEIDQADATLQANLFQDVRSRARSKQVMEKARRARL